MIVNNGIIQADLDGFNVGDTIWIKYSIYDFHVGYVSHGDDDVTVRDDDTGEDLVIERHQDGTFSINGQRATRKMVLLR